MGSETKTSGFSPQTKVSISGDKWYVNGEITYAGARAEGLLMNVRMVNSVFEDTKRTDFDPEANTDKFISQIPDYYACGVRGFTINLQGGMPGYEGAVNSAYTPEGGLRPEYLKRIRRAVEACDRQGIVIILGCYYWRQAHILQDEDAVRTGVVNAVRWVKKCGFTNVMMEIANEFDIGRFQPAMLGTPEGEVELIQLARKTAPDLLVSTSAVGKGMTPDSVASASDFILVHYNGTRTGDIPDRISALKKFDKPIVCNEDQKVGEEGAKAAELCVANGASWGFMHRDVNQYYPFAFDGHKDDPIVYGKLKELTTPATS